MFCGFCGKQIRDDATFCSFCGKQVKPLTDVALLDTELSKPEEWAASAKAPEPVQSTDQTEEHLTSTRSEPIIATRPRSAVVPQPKPVETPQPTPPLIRQSKVCDFAFVPKEWSNSPIPDAQPSKTPSPQPGSGVDWAAMRSQAAKVSEEAKGKAVQYGGVAKEKAKEIGGVAKEQAVKLGAAAKDKTTDSIRKLQAAPLKRIEKRIYPIICVASKASLLLTLTALFVPYCRIAYSAERAADMPLWKLILGGTYTMGNSNPLQFTLNAHPGLLLLLLIPLLVLLPPLFRKAKAKLPITYGILAITGLAVLIWNESVLRKIQETVSGLSLEVFEKEVVSMDSVMLKWVQNVIAGNLSFQNTFFATGRIGHALFAWFGLLMLLMGATGLLLRFLRVFLPKEPLSGPQIESVKVDPNEVNEESNEAAEDDDMPELTGDML